MKLAGPIQLSFDNTCNFIEPGPSFNQQLVLRRICPFHSAPILSLAISFLCWERNRSYTCHKKVRAWIVNGRQDIHSRHKGIVRCISLSLSLSLSVFAATQSSACLCAFNWLNHEALCRLRKQTLLKNYHSLQLLSVFLNLIVAEICSQIKSWPKKKQSPSRVYSISVRASDFSKFKVFKLAMLARWEKTRTRKKLIGVKNYFIFWPDLEFPVLISFQGQQFSGLHLKAIAT